MAAKRGKLTQVLSDDHHLYIFFYESEHEEHLKEWAEGLGDATKFHQLQFKVVKELNEWQDVCLKHKKKNKKKVLDDRLNTYIFVNKVYKTVDEFEAELVACMPSREDDMLGKDGDFERVMVYRICDEPKKEGYGVLKDDRFTVLEDLQAKDPDQEEIDTFIKNLI